MTGPRLYLFLLILVAKIGWAGLRISILMNLKPLISIVCVNFGTTQNNGQDNQWKSREKYNNYTEVTITYLPLKIAWVHYTNVLQN